MPDLSSSFFYEYRPATDSAILSEPIVLVPGWGFTHQCWGAFAEQLNRFAHVIVLDWPELPLEITSPEQTLAAIFEQWKKHLPNNAVYLGWSLGGMVVERWARAYPQRVSRWIALGANAQFVADDAWPTAMPKDTFDGFAQQVAQNWKSAGTYFIRLAGRHTSAQTLNTEQRKQQKSHQMVLQKELQSALLENSEQATIYLDLLAGLTSHSLFKESGFGLNDFRLNSFELNSLELPTSETTVHSQSAVLPAGLKIFADGDGFVPIEAANKMVAVPCVEVDVISASHALHLSATDTVIAKIRPFLEAGQFFCPKARIAQSFSRAAETYDSVAHLQRRVAANLMDQWQTAILSSDRSVDSAPTHPIILDIGCGTGALIPHVTQAFNNSQVIALDLAEGMVRFARQKHQDAHNPINTLWLCGDGESLPLASGSVDSIVSSLAVQWCRNLPQLLKEWWRVLRSGGSVAIATVGQNSLWQLREAWEAVDEHTHVNRFEPLAAWQSHWQASAFDLEHQSSHIESLCFSNVRELSHDLKALGAHNMNAGKPSGLMGRKRLLALESAYEQYRTSEGVPLDYEIHYFVARKL